MKINKSELGFLGINAILAGSGTAAGFTFTTLGALTALLNLTGAILTAVSIGGIVVFSILMLAVAGYFFYKNFHASQDLAQKLEETEKILKEKKPPAAINTEPTDISVHKLDKTHNPDSFLLDSPQLLGCVNLFINFGCLLGPCLGLIGAISAIGIIAGISAIAPPILIGIVVTAAVVAIIASYGIYYCESCNAERKNQIAAMEEEIKRLSNIDENVILIDSNNDLDSDGEDKSFGEPLVKVVEGTGQASSSDTDKETVSTLKF